MGPSALTGFVASTRGGGPWLRTYRPEELFDDNGSPVDQLVAVAAPGTNPMNWPAIGCRTAFIRIIQYNVQPARETP